MNDSSLITNVLDLNGVYKSYGEHDVLKNINFNVASGEVVVLIGPSGSGKSTLLRCCNGLEVAQKGDINVCGKLLLDSGTLIR